MRNTRKETVTLCPELLDGAACFTDYVSGALGLITVAAEQGGHDMDIARTARLAQYVIEETTEDLRRMADGAFEEDSHEKG